MNRVSVIVPTYNRRSLVPHAIDSVLAQSSPPFEVIVVDDGSSDGTSAMLRARYGSAIRLEQLPANCGRSAARNRGCRLAGGELVAFLDCDDRWLPDKLRLQVPHFENANVGLVHGYVGKIDLDGNVLKRKTDEELASFREAATRGYGYDGITEIWSRIYTSTVVMRRSLFEDAGGFDETMHAFEDWDLFWRAALEQQVATVTEIVSEHRVHPGNTHTTWEDAALPWRILNDKHLAAAQARSHEKIPRKALRNLQINRALASYWDGDRKESGQWMRRAIRTDPRFLTRPLYYTYGAPLLHALFPHRLAQSLMRRSGVDPYPGSVTLVVDDGPSDLTAQLLDILENNGHRAILFVLGNNIEGREEVLRNAIRRGFALGNHSFSHPRFSEITIEEGHAQITRTEALIDGLYAGTGVERQGHWFRFPYLDDGGTNREGLHDLLLDLGFPDGATRTTVNTEDWRLPGEAFIRGQLRNAVPGSVIESHDKPECIAPYAELLCDELRHMNLRGAVPRQR